MSGRSRSFSASCGVPAVSLGKSTPLPSWHRRRPPSPLTTDASGEQPCPHPSVVCHGRSQCSLDRGRMPVAKLVQYMPVRPSCSTPSHIAAPRNHRKYPAAGGGYRAHLRVVTENSFSLVVARSGPRNLRLVSAWGTTGVTLFSHSQMHTHAEALQCRMHDSTEMYVSSGSLASVVLVGSVSRHHEEGLSPGTADKYSPLQITAAASLTSSAGPVMGQLSIERFADPSWILRLHTNHSNTDPTCSVWQELPFRTTCGDIHSRSVRSTSSAAAHSTNSFTSASAPPSPTSPSCSPGQPARPASAPCSSRHNQSVPSTHPSRGAATSATPASLRPHRHPAAPCHQCRRSRGASSQPSRQSSSAPPPTALCHAQHHVSIGNTSGTMPSTHRKPKANAARGKWGHNQRTLQWLHEQTICMRVDSSRDNLILENDPVRREQNVTFTLAIVIQ
ncbi:regulator of sigma E protease [Trypanosoma cruzi]|nr:regulator of sigma E protease [Trypanosoma cruzi]